VIGVNTVDSDSMFQSLLVGKPVEIKTAGLFSDGTAVKRVGDECVRLCKQFVDDMILVTNDEICAAIKDSFEEARSILEPSGALAVAGLKRYLQQNPKLQGGVYVAVTSGANMNFDRLRFVAERAKIGDNNEVLLSCLIPEQPGSLLELYHMIYTKEFPRQVTEFSYRYSSNKEAHVFVAFEVKVPSEADDVVAKICSRGWKAIGRSGITQISPRTSLPRRMDDIWLADDHQRCRTSTSTDAAFLNDQDRWINS
jgi:threonine dehydratase